MRRNALVLRKGQTYEFLSHCEGFDDKEWEEGEMDG
jgi:hypothetical protein